jgi:hypothetical protein
MSGMTIDPAWWQSGIAEPVAAASPAAITGQSVTQPTVKRAIQAAMRRRGFIP